MSEEMPGRVRTGLRWSVTALSLGCLCCGLWSLTVTPSLNAVRWLALHFAQSPELRQAVALAVPGLVQALVCFVALGLLAVLFEIAVPVGAAAGAFAGALPLIVMLLAQGTEALSPAQALIARVVCVIVCALAGGVSVKRVRDFLEARVAPDDLDDQAAAAAKIAAAPEQTESADAANPNP